MVASPPVLFFLFQFTLLGLFLIKAIGMVRQFVVPHLKNVQQESNEKWFSLQEKHAVLIAKKKNMATQFLQQEKQISLLTAKLEAWYAAWKNTQLKRQQTFDDHAKKSVLRQAEQDKRVQEHRAAGRISRQVLAQTEEQLGKDLAALHKSYTTHALEKLKHESRIKPGRTPKRRSAPKKTKGAS